MKCRRFDGYGKSKFELMDTKQSPTNLGGQLSGSAPNPF